MGRTDRVILTFSLPIVLTKNARQMSADNVSQFSSRSFKFLRSLARNNNKLWFEEHRSDYERDVRQPMLDLIEEVDARIAVIIPEIVGTPRKSMFRIHRDVRFSKDKSPYKTHAACWFFHRDAGHGVGGEAVHGGAGFYFHMEGNSAFCGGGIWMPPRAALQRIRQAIAADPDALSTIVKARAFRAEFGALSETSMLTRMPKGYAADHPAATWLRYQSFTAGSELTLDDVVSPKLPDELARRYKKLVPFVRWLNSAIGLREVARR